MSSSHVEVQLMIMKYFREKPWGFPIFLSAQDQSIPDFWYRFPPKSEFMVSSPSFLSPFLISEVAKENAEDRSRMLLQAIAAARAGQCLMEDGAPIQFFVVAIYLCANLTAERYVVAHIRPNRQVYCFIHRLFVFTHREARFPFRRKILILAGQTMRSHSFVKCITLLR